MNKSELIKIANSRLLTVTSRPDIVMCKGQGMYLYDTEDNCYLDFIGGWAVNCLGHSPRVIADVLAEQSRTLINASPSFYNLPMLEYAALLTEQCCLDRVFFASTGAEANEGAIKLARKYGQVFKNGAFEIITTQYSFHGRTLATMAATGKQQWEPMFEPKAGGFRKAVFNDLDSVKQMISDKTCAIMIEPVQGEGGVNVAATEFVRGLRQLCDQENILLILDEIQTGLGRTGKLFCYEHYGVEPDIMTLGKGIGGGYPLAALLAKERLNIFETGEQGGTYTGQPLAMAVGLAVLKEILGQGLVEHSRKMGELLMAMLTELSSHYEIENIRGMGLLVAFDLTKTKGQDFVTKCLQDRLLINSPKERSIRLMPPLVVNEIELEELVVVLKKNLAGSSRLG
ncbi:MAG: acetylornithine/succinylornithine aminotransferase [Gammaproteobacteria bacterium]|nr:acetylornithine/succinylornithine aminotransferase [Gammaproteobacteria bacterium]MBM2830683.1 acetylornithine/succinylornithine aminotransferase [Gammaproteobacteria bacterium]